MSVFDGVERSQLKAWADQTAARSELPRLIRQLILETTSGLVGIGVPTSEFWWPTIPLPTKLRGRNTSETP